MAANKKSQTYPLGVERLSKLPRTEGCFGFHCSWLLRRRCEYEWWGRHASMGKEADDTDATT
eukprot:6899397-Prorocentrum_lima.AAC.1